MTNALSGLLGASAAALADSQDETANLVSAAAGREAVRVAERLGVASEPVMGIAPKAFTEVHSVGDPRVVAQQIEAVYAKRRLPDQRRATLPVPGRPSLLQDLLKGCATEIDYLNGAIADYADKVGVRTSMNRTLARMTHALERGEIGPGPGNLEYLAQALPSK